MHDYTREKQMAIMIARNAASEMLKIYSGQVTPEIKKDGSPVTVADQKANDYIVEELQKYFPDDGIVSEESPENVEGDRVWYIDPIDGTKSFINKTGQFAIHIGLAVNKKPVVGVVYKPISDEVYWGIAGVGAQWEGFGHTRDLKVTGDIEGRMVLAVGSTATDKPSGIAITKNINPSKIVRTGSEGLRLVNLAENISDVHFTLYNEQGTWDICAPQAVLEAAGGLVRLADGSEIEYVGQRMITQSVVAARTEKLLAYVLEQVQKSN